MTRTPGNWNTHDAVTLRWNEAGLDHAFRSYWAEPTNTNYKPRQEGPEARPNPPGAYCVVEISEPRKLNSETGKTATTYIDRVAVDLSFRVHAFTRSDLKKSGKQIAKELIKKVAAAYDGRPLGITEDTDEHRHVQTLRGPDVCTQEGDTEWSWSLLFTVVMDWTFDRPTY